jgi:hypothetical protein
VQILVRPRPPATLRLGRDRIARLGLEGVRRLDGGKIAWLGLRGVGGLARLWGQLAGLPAFLLFRPLFLLCELSHAFFVAVVVFGQKDLPAFDSRSSRNKKDGRTAPAGRKTRPQTPLYHKPPHLTTTDSKFAHATLLGRMMAKRLTGGAVLTLFWSRRGRDGVRSCRLWPDRGPEPDG